MDPACKRGVARALTGVEKRRSDAVWTSVDEAFAERMERERGATMSDVSVVSPAYATSAGLSAARRVFPAKHMRVHTDANIAVPDAQVRVYAPKQPSRDANDVDRSEEYPRNLHAKLYTWSTAHEAVAWLGSANFTAQALTKTSANGGNIEVLVRTRLAHDTQRSLVTELKQDLFEAPKGAAEEPAARDFQLGDARGSVIACELTRHNSQPRLIVYALAGTTEVTLGTTAHRHAMQLHKGRGTLEGKAVLHMLPGCDAGGAGVWTLYEFVGRDRCPVIVNAPLAPEPDISAPSHTALDALLDELRGVLPSRRRVDDEDNALDVETTASEDEDEQVVEAKKRLDEASHQGALDQLAVKIAVVRKLIVHMTAPGHERTELFARARADCSAVCDPHLLSLIHRWLS